VKIEETISNGYCSITEEIVPKEATGYSCTIWLCPGSRNYCYFDYNFYRLIDLSSGYNSQLNIEKSRLDNKLGYTKTLVNTFRTRYS